MFIWKMKGTKPRNSEKEEKEGRLALLNITHIMKLQ